MIKEVLNCFSSTIRVEINIQKSRFYVINTSAVEESGFSQIFEFHKGSDTFKFLLVPKGFHKKNEKLGM